RVNAGDCYTNAAVGIAHFDSEDRRSPEDQRKHGKCDEREAPIHPQHDHEDADEHEDIFKDRYDSGSEHFVQSIHVAGNARDKTAYRVFVEERDVHSLQMPKNLAAQIEHYLLSGPLHVVGLQELEQKAE